MTASPTGTDCNDDDGDPDIGRSKPLTILGELGRGTTARVFLAHDGGSRMLAVKVTRKRMLSPTLPKAIHNHHVACLLREISNLWALAGHPNIVRIVSSSVEDRRAHIVLEYHESDLAKELYQRRVRMSATARVSLMRQVLRALAFAHSKGIVHCDMKPGNVLMSPYGGGGDVTGVAVCDWGMSDRVDSGAHPLVRVITSFPYRAPEVLLYAPTYGPAVDVWSLGCMLVEVMTGQSPFWRGNVDDNRRQMTILTSALGMPTEDDLRSMGVHPSSIRGMKQRSPHPQFLADVPEPARGLAASMLQYDPRRRPSASEILSHSFFH